VLHPTAIQLIFEPINTRRACDLQALYTYAHWLHAIVNVHFARCRGLILSTGPWDRVRRQNPEVQRIELVSSVKIAQSCQNSASNTQSIYAHNVLLNIQLIFKLQVHTLHKIYDSNHCHFWICKYILSRAMCEVHMHSAPMINELMYKPISASLVKVTHERSYDSRVP